MNQAHIETNTLQPPILALQGIGKSFGGIIAAKDVHLMLPVNTVTCLVGPNGAGKTTLFNLITGILQPDTGQILFHSKTLANPSPTKVAKMGIARSFQHLRLFNEMTVFENILTVMEQSAWGFLNDRRDVNQERCAQVKQIMETVGLTQLAETRAIDLGYGEQKFLSLARIMAMKAPVWLLDEPASGMDRHSYERLFAILRHEVSAGTTICLIEHNLDVVREISDRIAFLDQGTVLAQGDPHEVLNDSRLSAIYFGDR